MSSAAIISGVSFFALGFTGEETAPDKAGISGLDETSFDLNKRRVHTPVSESRLGHAAGTVPFYGFGFPQHVKVGEEFEIDLPPPFSVFFGLFMLKKSVSVSLLKTMLFTNCI